MCTDSDYATKDSLNALENVMEKISLQSRGVAMAEIRQDMWLPAPPGAINKGYLKIQGLGHDDNNWSYSIIKIYPQTETMVHYHKDTIEKFLLIKGEFDYRVYEDEDKKILIRKGKLSVVGEIAVIHANEWHLVLTSQTETYVVLIYKKELP